jgi:hypothetical protein
MDSCIEELAGLILERAAKAAKNCRTAAERETELSLNFSSIEASARSMLVVINEYRNNHPELYEDTAHIEVQRLRGQVETYKDQLILARNELRHYKEREKTQGWDNS